MNVLKPLFYFGFISGVFACLSSSRQPSCVKRDDLRQLIVGGEYASIKDFPFAGVMYQPNICGCTIISEKFVLTAAHCVFDSDLKKIPASKFKLRFGSDCFDEKGVTTGVFIVRVHGSYDKVSKDYDIAFMILSDTLEFYENVKSVKYASSSDLFAPGVDAWIVGWGTKQQGTKKASKYLQSAKVSTLNHDECKGNYESKGDTLTYNMICAGNFAGGADSCQGDSGGGLFVKKNDEYLLVGITSWGRGCALPLFPGVYTKVSNTAEWIATMIKEWYLAQPCIGCRNLA